MEVREESRPRDWKYLRAKTHSKLQALNYAKLSKRRGCRAESEKDIRARVRRAKQRVLKEKAREYLENEARLIAWLHTKS